MVSFPLYSRILTQILVTSDINLWVCWPPRMTFCGCRTVSFFEHSSLPWMGITSVTLIPEDFALIGLNLFNMSSSAKSKGRVKECCLLHSTNVFFSSSWLAHQRMLFSFDFPRYGPNHHDVFMIQGSLEKPSCFTSQGIYRSIIICFWDLLKMREDVFF